MACILNGTGKPDDRIRSVESCFVVLGARAEDVNWYMFVSLLQVDNLTKLD